MNLYVISASILMSIIPLYSKIFQIFMLRIIFVKCLQYVMKPRITSRCPLRNRCKGKELFRINKKKRSYFSEIGGL